MNNKRLLQLKHLIELERAVLEAHEQELDEIEKGLPVKPKKTNERAERMEKYHRKIQFD